MPLNSFLFTNQNLEIQIFLLEDSHSIKFFPNSVNIIISNFPKVRTICIVHSIIHRRLREVGTRENIFQFSKEVAPYNSEIRSINANFLQTPCPDNVIRIRILGDKYVALFISRNEKFFFPLDS